MATMQDFQNQRLKAYYEAEQAVLSGQSYTIGNRTLTRANLSEIRRAIDDLIAGGAVLEGFETKKKMSNRVVFMQ